MKYFQRRQQDRNNVYGGVIRNKNILSNYTISSLNLLLGRFCLIYIFDPLMVLPTPTFVSVIQATESDLFLSPFQSQSFPSLKEKLYKLKGGSNPNAHGRWHDPTRLPRGQKLVYLPCIVLADTCFKFFHKLPIFQNQKISHAILNLQILLKM